MPARRGTFIVPAEVRWTIKGYFADLTSRSLRRTGSEGHACRARRSGMDNPIWGGGRDKRVPPRRGLTSRSLGKVVCGSIAPRPRDQPTTRRRHPLDLSEVGSEAKGTSLRKKLSFDACSGRPGEALCFGQQSWANPVFWQLVDSAGQ